MWFAWWRHRGHLPKRLDLLVNAVYRRWVRADAKRLRQILLNLLGNAVRFTDQEQVTLQVDARRVLRFNVIDTGIGIAPRSGADLLPFERGSGGRRSAEPGTRAWA